MPELYFCRKQQHRIAGAEILSGMVRFLVTIAFWCFTSGMLQAQTHLQAWFRTTLSYPLSTRLRADSEVQYRRQSGSDNGYIPDKSLMYSFRQWLTYRCDEQLSLSLSPLAWFTHYKSIDQPADTLPGLRREFRVSAATEWRQPVGSKIHIVYRSAAEYCFMSGATSPAVRLRYRTGLSYAFGKDLRLSLAGETFLHLFRTDIMDQNRLMVQADYTISRHIRIDPGFVCISRPRGLNQPSLALVLFLNLMIRL